VLLEQSIIKTNYVKYQDSGCKRVSILIHTWFPNHQMLFDLIQKERDDFNINYMVFSAKDANRAWDIKKDALVKPTVVPGLRLALFSREVNFNFRISKYLSTANPQLIITKGWGDPGYFSAHRFAIKRRIPAITWMCGREKTIKNSGIFRRIASRLGRKVIASSKFVFVYGTVAKNDAIDLGAKPENVIVVKHMVNDRHFDYRSSPITDEARKEFRKKLGFDESPLFLCISQLVKRKGITDLLKAFDILKKKRPGIQLLLIGKGPMQGLIERYAEDNNRVFKWIPSVPYEQISSYYRICDCFVFPTHFDAWGTVVNESHWARLPIICSEGAHASYDLIKQGQSGFVYPAGNIEKLTELMEYAVDHGNEMKRFSDNGYNFVNSQWNLGHSVKLWSRYIALAIDEK
jgi:glycosyltransferase involved in cell wall biosynthesis